MNNTKSTKQWLKEFKKNSKNSLKVPFDCYQLTKEEKELITPSIQSFQLGESSTGSNLKKFAREYAIKYGCPYYYDLIELFIKEENRHSSYLWQFMRQHDIPKAEQTNNDSVFRFVRSLLGIELSIRVLATAELIAISYYSALSKATRSSVLKNICNHMLNEEEDHLLFQFQHIQMINLKKNIFFSTICDSLHFLFIIFTCFAVWAEHKHVLKINYSLGSFIKEVSKNLFNAILKGRDNAKNIMYTSSLQQRGALCS